MLHAYTLAPKTTPTIPKPNVYVNMPVPVGSLGNGSHGSHIAASTVFSGHLPFISKRLGKAEAMWLVLGGVVEKWSTSPAAQVQLCHNELCWDECGSSAVLR